MIQPPLITYGRQDEGNFVGSDATNTFVQQTGLLPRLGSASRPGVILGKKGGPFSDAEGVGFVANRRRRCPAHQVSGRKNANDLLGSDSLKAPARW